MFRSFVCLLVTCFFSSLSSSVAFSQGYYETIPTVWLADSYQPYSFESLPTESFSVLSYPPQSYSVPSYPAVQYAAPVDISAQSSGYSSAGTPSQIYVPGYGVMEHIINPNYGYSGPGDMRTHLWKDHASDLQANGVSLAKLKSMSMESVQKWHNFFHGTEGRPSQ